MEAEGVFLSLSAVIVILGICHSVLRSRVNDLERQNFTLSCDLHALRERVEHLELLVSKESKEGSHKDG